MNRAERIYRLHREFSSKTSVSLKELMDRLEISRATVIRDITYMRDFMGAPIQYLRELNGYRYDPDSQGFELPGLWFNDSELYALLATEQLLETVQPGLLGPYIGPLKSRIRKLLEHSGHQSETVISRIRLQPMAQRLVSGECFGQVSSAVLNEQCLKIQYHGRERGEITYRTIHPYRLMHYRDNWYLIAWCERANGYRTFSMDRVHEVEILEQLVNEINDKKLTRYINASFGIFAGEATNWAVLRFSPRRSHWVADEIWHTEQIGQWRGSEYELQVPYSDERELLMDILKYGPDVEVIAPGELRNIVSEQLYEAAKNYSD